jgi:hypothetical protein
MALKLVQYIAHTNGIILILSTIGMFAGYWVCAKIFVAIVLIILFIMPHFIDRQTYYVLPQDWPS